MPETPQDPDQRRIADRPLAADDRRNRNHVIRIGGVAHPEKEPQRGERQEGEHAAT
jgi:hypothetical protein